MRIRSKLLLKLGAWCFAKSVQALFKTLDVDLREHPGTNPYVDNSEWFFYSVWHDQMVTPAFGGSQHQTAALTSQHKDGSFVAGVLRAIGMRTVRGSTGRSGAGAIRRLIKLNSHVVITPDGPRGPRHQVSSGIVYLASKTGRGIIPSAVGCERFWKIPGSWTDLVMPKPFSKVYMLGGEPIYVPSDADRDTLEAYRLRVQQAMEQLDAEAARLANHTAEDKQPNLRGVRSRRYRADGSHRHRPHRVRSEARADAELRE